MTIELTPPILVLLGLFGLISPISALVATWDRLRRKPPLEAQFLSRNEHTHLCDAEKHRRETWELDIRRELRSTNAQLANLSSAVARIEGKLTP